MRGLHAATALFTTITRRKHDYGTARSFLNYLPAGAPIVFSFSSSWSTARSSSVSSSSNRSLSLSSSISYSNILSIEECLTLAATQSDNARIVFVDGSWYMPNAQRDARKEFEIGPRIPGSIFFDIDDIASKENVLNPKGLPHMMPSADLFSTAMDAMGIKNEDRIVVYARKGCFAAPRTWFTFKSMAHDPSHVHIMNGGIDDWEAMGGSLETGSVITVRAADFFSEEISIEPNYKAREPTNVVDMEYVATIINEGYLLNDAAIIVDARSPGRFSGKEVSLPELNCILVYNSC